MTADQALVCQRFLTDGALAMIWGSGGLGLLCRGQAARHLRQQLRGVLLVSAVLAFLGATAALPLQTALFADDWNAALNLQSMVLVATQTVTGLSVAWESAACLVLLAAVIGGREKVFVMLSAAALILTVTRGHANENAVRMAVAALHVLSACAWFGALYGFLKLLPMSREDLLRADAIASMRRFSLMGHVAVAATLGSGVASALMILGHVPVNLGSPYEMKLLAKLGAALLMVGLAVFNRYWALAQCRTRPHVAFKALRWAAAAEIALGLFALWLVASLGLDDPT